MATRGRMYALPRGVAVAVALVCLVPASDIALMATNDLPVTYAGEMFVPYLPDLCEVPPGHSSGAGGGSGKLPREDLPHNSCPGDASSSPQTEGQPRTASRALAPAPETMDEPLRPRPEELVLPPDEAVTAPALEVPPTFDARESPARFAGSTQPTHETATAVEAEPEPRPAPEPGPAVDVPDAVPAA